MSCGIEMFFLGILFSIVSWAVVRFFDVYFIEYRERTKEYKDLLSSNCEHEFKIDYLTKTLKETEERQTKVEKKLDLFKEFMLDVQIDLNKHIKNKKEVATADDNHTKRIRND